MVHLSTQLAVALGERYPGLVLDDDLVDRSTALSRLAVGELDLAIVFDYDFLPAPPAPEVDLVPLFDDPVRVLLPAHHRLARRTRVALRGLAGDVWIRAHDGTAAQLVDHVLASGDLAPRTLLAGHGDEPVETQALVLAGKGVTVAHELNVVPDPSGWPSDRSPGTAASATSRGRPRTTSRAPRCSPLSTRCAGVTAERRRRATRRPGSGQNARSGR